MTPVRDKLDNFIKKNCSFCKKVTYEKPINIMFGKKEIPVTFCKNCNTKGEEEKAIIFLGQIIKNNPEKDISDILKIMMMETNANE